MHNDHIMLGNLLSNKTLGDVNMIVLPTTQSLLDVITIPKHKRIKLEKQKPLKVSLRNAVLIDTS